MKLRRYFATDMRQGLQMIREAQGADVLILSNCKVTGGIELITADEYSPNELVQQQAVASTSRLRATSTPSRTAVAEKTKISPRRPAGPRPAASQPERGDPTGTTGSKARVPAGKQPNNSKGPEVIWTQEPLLQQMREEVQTLRRLLEQQVSGLAWGQLGRSHPVRASIMDRLAGLGMTRELIAGLVEDVGQDTPMEQAWRDSMARLREGLHVYSCPLLQSGGVAALVGPSGVGKTTLIAKLASRFAMLHKPGEVALITTDTQRIGAREQLRSIGRIIGVPVWTVASRDDLREALLNTVDRRLVLIDTAGMGHHDGRLGEHLRLIQDVSPQLHTYLTLSATTQASGLMQAAAAFAEVQPVAAMVTHLDEATALGPLLSVLIQARLPVAFVSAGQNIPDDLHEPDPDALIAQMNVLNPSFEKDEKVILGGLSNGDWMHANI